MPAWLLTSTTYSQWLPGDRRGSVTSVRDVRPGDPPNPARLEHDRPGEWYEDAIPELEADARDRLRGPPVVLGPAHAAVAVAQFRETAAFRRWELLATAVMFNHVHLVVRPAGDPGPDKLLGDFKSYASRALSARFGRPTSGTWWTKSGSTRKLPDDRAVRAAVRYVTERQPNPLAVWVADEFVGTPDGDSADEPPTPYGAGSLADSSEPAP